MIVERELQEALQKIGLQTDVTKILGKNFIFALGRSQTFSPHHILVGTIMGIEVSREGTVNFFVSVPRVEGDPLRRIFYHNINDEWVVEVEKSSQRIHYTGKLEILASA